jgi:AraC-like DNA-binding protein
VSLQRRIEFSRHASELGHWEAAVAKPHPLLRACVREYVGASEETPSPLRRRELPTEIAPLIINFGAPFRLFDATADPKCIELRSFVTGAFDTYALVESTGAYCCVQVNFTILGARLFLQRPLKDLTNREVALDDVLGEEGRRLEMRLHDAATWEGRFDLLDRVILERVAQRSDVPAAVSHAWERLLCRAGQVDIAALVRETGWSHKHFVAQFSEHIGLRPKALARVLRFGRAAELLKVSERGRFADIAYACGYYDQAHFTRDFSAFAGVSPSALLASRLPNRGGFAGTPPCTEGVAGAPVG